MSRKATALVILLRFLGVTSLFALVAVFMPFSWMASTHRWLGLGEIPTAKIVEYLARWVSAFYGFFGALCLILSADLERYRSVIRFLGIALAAMSIVATGVDLTLEMPWWWTAFEGPPGVAIGCLILVLASPDKRRDSFRSN
jgi:hypothetical protein